MIYLTSAQNKFVKNINALKSKKERDNTTLFLIEGERSVLEIPTNYEIKYYILSEYYLNKFGEKECERIFNRAKIYIFTNEIFKKISETTSPQGVMAVCVQKKFEMDDILNKENNFFVILENISDPGNLGTIIRTADAAAASAVLVSKDSADLYNSKVIRATMGSIFHIPIITNLNIEETIKKLKDLKVKVFATHLKATKNIYSADFKTSCAVLIGNEANGLSKETTELADELIKIPMPGKAESMNASIASGITIYEIVRQRLNALNNN